MTSTEFRTTFAIPAPAFTLSPQSGPLLLLGSCFTTEIGERLRMCGYPCVVNPCGVQYNPASIAALIDCALGLRQLADTIFCYESYWRSWLFPTSFARAAREEAEAACLAAIAALRDALARAEALILTLGTAWVYEHVGSGYQGIVGNCHKLPAREFSRRRLSVQEIVECWLPILDRLHTLNPALKLICTVSPIRHFKDGAHENTLSKATLQLALDSLLSHSLSLPAEYFPAAELLLDDLRDYRFYAPDMLHPSSVAVDYIWSRFSTRYFTVATLADLKTRAAAIRREAHRPLLSR